MVVAGNETTTKLLGQRALPPAGTPDQRDEVLAAGRSATWWRRWVEETLRYDNSTQMLARLRHEPTSSCTAARSPAGSKLLLLIGSANRDERVFTDPADYDIHRVQGRAGREPELRRPAGTSASAPTWRGSRRAWCCAELVRRVERFEVDPDRAVRVHSVNVRGFAQLPTTFTQRGALMGKYEQPERRPTVVTGASSGIGAETALVLAAAGHPVALGARRADRCEERRGRDPRRRGRGGRPRPRRRRRRLGRRRSPPRWPPTSATSRSWSATPASVAPGETIEVDDRAVRPGARRQPARRPPAGAGVRARHGRAAARRHRVRLLRRGCPSRGRSCRPTPPASGASREWPTHCRWSSRAPASGRRSCVPARPGARWAPTGTPTRRRSSSTQWVRSGLARHPHFLKARAIADAITTVVSAPRGVHLSLVDVNPEAPLEER